MTPCTFCKAPLLHAGAGCQTEDGARNCDHYVFSPHRPFPQSIKREPGQLERVRAELAAEHALPFTHGRIKELIREYASNGVRRGHIAGEILSCHAPALAEAIINDFTSRTTPASPSPVRDAGPSPSPQGEGPTIHEGGMHP